MYMDKIDDSITLEKNMILYKLEDNNIQKYKITRVTEEQALIEQKSSITKDIIVIARFKKNQKDKYHIHRLREESYSREHFSIETPELIGMYELQFLYHKFKKIDYKNLTIDQLRDIIDIANKKV